MTETKHTLQHFPKLGYTVKTWLVNPYVMGFEVYSLCSREAPFTYERKNAVYGTDDTSKLEEAGVYLQGSLKWDGCINYSYPALDNCMLHACGLSDLAGLFAVFNQLYVTASKCIENFDDDLSGLSQPT